MGMRSLQMMRTGLSTICVAAGLFTGHVFAQASRDGTLPDPQTMALRRVDRLARELSMTDAQKTNATTIFTDAYTASQSIRSDFQSNRQALSEAVKKNDTTAIDSLSIVSGTLDGQMIAVDSRAEAAFYAILTADQQAKYDSLPRGPGGPMDPARPGPQRFTRPPR
jgi:Spy/CpxP family protein refolding chaperone